ncbi:MAG: hypothetical protein LBE95_00680 [Holosporaceae bacterium]|nr:hypothetical protein [Holosporaceae bacterium]
MEQLFEEWKKRWSYVVTDGIVNEAQYEKLDGKKVLYILKEVNGGGNWDLREFLREGARGYGQTWNNIIRWQYGIEHVDEKVSWEALEESVADRSLLQHIAAINLRKDDGTGSANMDVIYEHAQKDRNLLQRQIELCRPDLIICCGTGDIVKELQLAGNFDRWNISITGVAHAVTDKYIIIHFYHPNAHIKSWEAYFLLTETYKVARELKNKEYSIL